MKSTRAKLLSQWGDEKGSEFVIAGEVTIGRGGDNTVRLGAKAVSSQHARIYLDDERGGYFLEDLGSLNGTELAGTPVRRPERLGSMDLIRFGGVSEFLFVELASEEAQTSAEEPPPESVTVSEAVEAKEQPPAPEPEPPEAPDAVDKTLIDREIPELPESLRVQDEDPDAPAAAGASDEGSEAASPDATQIDSLPLSLPQNLSDLAPADEAPPAKAPGAGELALSLAGDTPKRFPLRQGRNVIGRGRNVAVRLRDSSVSRRHAVLNLSGARVTLLDLKSRNHTYLEGEQILEETELQPPVRLRFGLVETYLLRHDDEPTIPVKTE